MDEYVGLAARRRAGRSARGSTGTSVDVVRPGAGRAARSRRPPIPAAECRRYGALLADGGLDLALIGIGENGHVAFNDPHVADFDDPEVVKPVAIDETSRPSRSATAHSRRSTSCPASRSR